MYGRNVNLVLKELCLLQCLWALINKDFISFLKR